MRKLFSQKSKHKTLTEATVAMSLLPLNKDANTKIEPEKPHSLSNPTETTVISENEMQIIENDSMLTEPSINNPIKQDDNNIEKPQKLFVVVSDADSACTPSMSNETTEFHLLNVDECDMNESIKTSLLRQRSSTFSAQHFVLCREQNTKKILEERLRRRSWMACQANNSQTSDIILQYQQTMSLLRSRRYRISQSEPNLTSMHMDLSNLSSPSVKTSPRTSSVTTNTLQLISRRSSTRRPILPGLNLINLKHVFRKQLSSQQNFSAMGTDLNPDLNSIDQNSDRRWSLTSAPSSSGYGTTSPTTSPYSSFEKLQHQQHSCTCRQQLDSYLFDDLQRLESHSLSMSLLDANISSTPNKLMIIPDQDMNTMAIIYKERYPKAKIQMEERLQNFIDTHKLVDKFDYCSDGSARFIHNHIVELAKDCLEKSNNDLITTLYFNEMTDNLERLLLNANEKCPLAIENLQTIVRKLLLIIARSARLLECLHFDPEEFLRTLEEVESQAKTISHIKQDIPKYICSKLNLDRNPLDLIDNLQNNETINHELEYFKTLSLSESENEFVSDSNYLTITPNTQFSPIERQSSIKGPCEEDFEVLKLISNGAYGAVHLVKHRQTLERYAMKKISKSHLILRNQIEQAFVERDIMTFTDNPFVVALICTFETKSHLCLVMEYVEGGDVATLLKNIGGPLNIDIARMYFAETTLAVEYLHSYGIIHRDLKPDNLLITAIGHIKLTDFGLSKIGLMSLTTSFYEKLLDKETKAFNDMQICGTPSYIAPEVILRQGYGKPVDWWSMGIILYEFLVGVPPFTGNTPDELFANVINGVIDWEPLDVDLEENSSDAIVIRDAKDLMEQLLQHDPSKRLGTLGEAYEIRSHAFCSSINWNTLLREKADFVPVLESPDDTSYFDTRQDRYKHIDDDDDNSSIMNRKDSDSLFASFSSVPLKYVFELSGNTKQRSSNKSDDDSASVKNVLRANSCTDTFSSTSVIQIDSTTDFQPLLMSKSMTNEPSVESSSLQTSFELDTFEPLHISSDESECSSKKLNSSSSSSLSSSQKMANTDDKKITSIGIKHYKQRKPSLKNIEKQKSIDSGDDSIQEKPVDRTYKKSRIPRPLSPIKSKQTNLVTPIVSISDEHCSPPSSASYKSMKYTNQQQKCSYSRSLSKSFSSSSSSSSPPSSYYFNQDDRSHRQSYRHKMTISPLERDTTHKVEQQSLYLLSSINSLGNSLRPPIIIRRGPRSFGFTLRAVKVFHGNTDYYTTQHVVVAVEGPAQEAGLKPNDVITHVNEHSVVGLMHSEVVKLILSGSERLSIRAVPCSETQIRTGGRRRSPSKQKIRYQPQPERKLSTIHSDHHQSHCLKHRMNSLGNNIYTNPNKKYQQNTSLFRRLSERKVARDIEAAAAAAAASISLAVPNKSMNTNTNHNEKLKTTTATDADPLSSSLPLLSFQQLLNDANSERSPSISKSSRSSMNEVFHSSPSSSLPSIRKQRSPASNTSSINSASSTDEPVYPSLYKTISEPYNSPAQVNPKHDQNRSSYRRHNNDQNSNHRPSISTNKKKLIRQGSFHVSSSQRSPLVGSKSTLENNLARTAQLSNHNHDQLTRSYSMGAATSYYNYNSQYSSTSYVPTKFFYRRP